MTGPDKQDELVREQTYFDDAEKHRKAHEENRQEAPRAAANRYSAAIAKEWARGQRDPEGDERAVAFARIDDESGEKFYIGRKLITDDHHEALVINWQAPAADRYYSAEPTNPRGLALRRVYRCDANTILDFSDTVFASDETVDEFLLRELERARTGTMRDIVATIRAAQFDIIQQRPDQALVLAGGPGAGKTVIALHRVSWLLHRHPEVGKGGVLVVGPNPTFLRYIDGVLPALGNAGVHLRTLANLAPSVTVRRSEPDEVARLKGDVRMEPFLRRALYARLGQPADTDISIPGLLRRLFRSSVTIPGVEIVGELETVQQLKLPYAEQQTTLKHRLTSLVHRYTEGRDPRRDELERLVKDLWPDQTSPEVVLGRLYADTDLLASAADGLLTDQEVTLLRRPEADGPWSEADLPLLQELARLIYGVGARYGHIVVDEAQDLSPMQLRSLVHRSATGSMTVLGDVAQSTGVWARDTWDEVTACLPEPVAVQTLRYGYRVPRQVIEFAAQLLPAAAPGTSPPTPVRDGPSAPSVHRVDAVDRANRVSSIATEHAAAGRFVGIVCAELCRPEVETALTATGARWSSVERTGLDAAAINLVGVREAKGLEFDAVVVVEPEAIVAEHKHGHRMLYIALTRTTKFLDIVCAGEPMPT